MNFDIKKMPLSLVFVVILGLVAPFIMILSAWGELNGDGADHTGLSGFLLVCAFALVVFLSTLGIIFRKPYALWFYLLGWVLTCLSPMLRLGSQDNVQLIVVPMLFNLVIGIGIFIYLKRNKNVDSYFTKT